MLETAWESRWLPGSLKNLLVDFEGTKQVWQYGSRRNEKHCLIIQVDWIRQINMEHLSGGDALRGHTRSHPEHDG